MLYSFEEIVVSYSTLALFLPIAMFCASTCAAQDNGPLAEQGMVVVRDAENGQLRSPTAAELSALHRSQGRAHMHRSSARIVASRPALVVGPDGRRTVRLGESHLGYAVVTRGSDDKLVEQCVDGAHAAEQLVAQPGPATEPEGDMHELR